MLFSDWLDEPIDIRRTFSCTACIMCSVQIKQGEGHSQSGYKPIKHGLFAATILIQNTFFCSVQTNKIKVIIVIWL